MKARVAILVCTLLLGLAAEGRAAIVINEIDSDQPGPDSREFVELHGPANTMLNGLVLVFWNGANDTAYQAFDLDGWQTGPTGHFLLGTSSVIPAPDIEFPVATLHNGPDAVALYAADATDFPFGTALTNSNLLDAIVYGAAVSPDDTELLTVLGQATQYEEDHNNSISRVPDGMGNSFVSYTVPSPMNSGIAQVPEPTALVAIVPLMLIGACRRTHRAAL